MEKIELSVQGLRYYHGPREFQDGNLRRGAEIYLSPDPGNAHDPNAVEVILAGAGKKLGHVPKTQAGWVSDLLRRNYRLSGQVTRVGLSRKSYPDSLFCVVEVELPLGCQSRKSYKEIRRGLHVYDIDEKCLRIRTFVWRDTDWGLTAERQFPRGREPLDSEPAG